MAYGEIKVDTITFTDGGIDKSVTISGLVQNPTFSGNITVTGTISGNTVRGQTISGVTVTGTTAQFTSGTFTTITGGVATITSGVFASGNAAGPSVSVGTTTNGIYSPATNQIAIATSGTGRLFIDSSGGVGIGTQPFVQLHLAGPARIGLNNTDDAELQIGAGATGNRNAYIDLVGDTTYTDYGLRLIRNNGGANGSSVLTHRGTGTLFIGCEDAGNIGFRISNTERVRIDSSGRVGIGTSSPSATTKMSIVDSTSAGIYLLRTAEGETVIENTGPLTIRQSSGNGANQNIFFKTGASVGTEVTAMTIDGSQRVGIGTTSPATTLDVLGNQRFSAASPVLEFNNGGPQIFLPGANTLAFATGGGIGTPTERARIDSSGRLLVGTSSIVLGSPQTIVEKTSSDIDLFRVQCGATETAGNIAGLSFGHGPNGSRPKTAIGAVATGSFGLSNLVFYVDSTADNNSVSSSDEKMRIDTSGRVGIGSTSPQGIFQVGADFGGKRGGSSTDIVIADTTSGVTRFFEFQSASNATRSILFSDATTGNYGTIGYSHSDDALIFQAAANERARIDSSGRLLVGTSTTSVGCRQVLEGSSGGLQAGIQILAANTSSPADNSALGAVYFADNTHASGLGICADIFCRRDGGTWSASSKPTRLVFSTTADGASSPTERMRIDNTGAVLIGSTSYQSGLGANTKFQVTSPGGDWALGVVNSTATAANNYGIRILYGSGGPNGTANEFLYCGDPGVLRASIRSNGGLANYQANNVNLSDINTKKDVSPAASTWDCLKEWEIVNYRYKDQPDDADLNLGVIAQQVAESCPEVITVFQEAKEATEDQPAQEERLGIKEQQMYWMAIKALQEAQVRIEALEAEVAALKAQ